MSSASMRTVGAPTSIIVGSTPSILAAHLAVHRKLEAATRCPFPPVGGSESMHLVEGTPIEQVKAMWAAYARGGVEAMHDVVGDTLVEWIPLGAEEPLAPERFWGEWAHRQTEQVSVTVHSFEEH